MRYVRFLLIPREGELHPIDEAFAAEPGVERRAIHQFRMLADDSAVTLYELSGDRGTAEALLGDHEDVLSFDVAESADGLFVHSHFRAAGLAGGVYRVPQQLGVVLDMPMEYTDRGALRVTAIGEFETFQRAIREMPEGVGLELLETGEYRPDASQLYAGLTERQQETLRTAIDAGYYEVPREVTYRDIADELDVSAGTVGEHLRKVESHVLKQIAP